MQRPFSTSQVPRRVAASDRQSARVVDVFPLQYYRKRGSASYIVREVHSVRERERERERERDTERERKTEVTSPLSR